MHYGWCPASLMFTLSNRAGASCPAPLRCQPESLTLLPNFQAVPVRRQTQHPAHVPAATCAAAVIISRLEGDKDFHSIYEDQRRGKQECRATAAYAYNMQHHHMPSLQQSPRPARRLRALLRHYGADTGTSLLVLPGTPPERARVLPQGQDGSKHCGSALQQTNTHQPRDFAPAPHDTTNTSLRTLSSNAARLMPGGPGARLLLTGTLRMQGLKCYTTRPVVDRAAFFTRS